jgi:nitrogen regulatory protein P-II 1
VGDCKIDINLLKCRVLGHNRRTEPLRDIGKPAPGKRPMKLVVAIIKPFKLNSVQNALHAVGVSGLTISEARGHGHQKGHSDIYGSVEYVAEFIPKLRIEVITPDNLVSPIVRAIADAAKTGLRGDGKIMVLPLDDLVKIGSSEKGAKAL